MKKLYSYLKDIVNLASIAEENIDRLRATIAESRKEIKLWQGLLEFSQTSRKLANEEAGEKKKGQLRYKWTALNIQGSKVWSSEVGEVNLKAWGKYQGFPKCLEHLRPFADGDHSSNHMAKRPKHDEFDDNVNDFDTLIDCQLAVEKAHEDWQKKQKKEK